VTDKSADFFIRVNNKELFGEDTVIGEALVSLAHLTPRKEETVTLHLVQDAAKAYGKKKKVSRGTVKSSRGTAQLRLLVTPRLSITGPTSVNKNPEKKMSSSYVGSASLSVSQSVVDGKTTPRKKKSSKRFPFSRRNKVNKRAFGLAIDEGDELPEIIEQTIELLSDPKALRTEGLFRVSASMADVDELRVQFEGGQNISDSLEVVDPHVVAGLLMAYLLALPEPPVPFDLYDSLIAAEEYVDDEQSRLKFLKKLLSLPPHLQRCVEAIMRLCSALAATPGNKMSVRNLAIVFGPALMRREEENAKQIVQDSPIVIHIVSSLIENFAFFFENGDPIYSSAAASEGAAASSAGDASNAVDGSARGCLVKGTAANTSGEAVPCLVAGAAGPVNWSRTAFGADLQPLSGQLDRTAVVPTAREGRRAVAAHASQPAIPQIPPIPSLLDPSVPTPRRRDVEPARFHAVLNMILAAITNVTARVHFLRVALDDDDVARSKPHVVVSAAKLGASLGCLLSSVPGSVPLPPLLLRAPVQVVPAVTDPAQLDLVKKQLLKARRASDHVSSSLHALSEQLSIDTLLLAQAAALDMVIKAGHLLRDMGKLLDNFQQFVIPLTPRTEIHPQLRRLRGALLSAIDGIKKRQVAMLQQELSKARSLDQAVAIANVVRKVEKVCVVLLCFVFPVCVLLCFVFPVCVLSVVLCFPSSSRTLLSN
jgi:RhoGAP domain